MSTVLKLESDPLARIVVATDFSETASLALDRAMDIATRHQSEIALVHVMQPELPPLAAPEMVGRNAACFAFITEYLAERNVTTSHQIEELD